MTLFNRTAIRIPIFAGALLIGACSQTGFMSAKSEALSKGIFAPASSDPDSASGAILQPGGTAGGAIRQPSGGNATGTIGQLPGGGSIGAINQPSGADAGGGITQGTKSGIPLKFICSYTEAELSVGTTASTAASLVLKVKDAAGNVACEKTAGVKEYIAKNKALDLSGCNLTGTAYTATLVDPAKPTQDLFFATLLSRNFFLQDDYINLKRADANSVWTATSQISATQSGINIGGTQGVFAEGSVVGVLWATNASVDRFNSNVDNSACDATASPLVVNFADEDEPLQLTSPRDGVWFDILGLNAKPYPHAKQRISWLTNPRYMFLALPARGRVQGIDQLFGNNTYGPDYAFADNGFAALRKYDDNRDGFINAGDKIFRDLRLWSDENLDGVAQPRELKSFAEMGVTEIDLSYDPTYYERDQYGNESRFRSVVKTVSGKLHVIFDLWFALK
jgi:hypothetical protein